jgi:membrane protease YdiL (CAAX protease family)
MKNYALKNPVLFSIIIILIFFIMMVGSFITGTSMSVIPNGKNIGEFLSKLIIAAVLLIILWQFNWLEVSGINNPGSFKNWLCISPFLIYAILSTAYAYTGIIKISIINSTDDIFLGANMLGTGLIEELAFRGLIFYCFLLAWSHKKNSLILSGVISAALFGISHLVWVILGKEFIQGLLQALGAFISGIFYAAIISQTRSIWSVVLIHGLTNAFVYITISDIPNYKETINNGIMDILFGIPLVLYGLFILFRLSNKMQINYKL